MIANIQEAAERLRSGGVVAFPTETVYGLGADAFNELAVARVFALKNRPGNNPLIVHVSGPEMARRVVAAWPEEAERLAREFWPGPLSFILPKRASLPLSVTAGGEYAAVRCPSHPTALALLFEFDGALVGPSANPSGAVSPTTAEHVRDGFGDADLTILDGGACTAGIESTVLSLIEVDAPRVLRPGVIGADEIAGVLGRRVSHQDRSAARLGPLRSPGLLDRHYAPHAPAKLFRASEWPDVVHDHDGAVVVITHQLREVGPPHAILAMPEIAEQYAAALYTALREADALKPSMILIEQPPTDGAIWHAITDRLTRATTP